MEANNTIPEAEKECIHLTKNSRGWNWELKIYPIGSAKLDDNGQRTGEKEYIISEVDIERLERLNNIMIDKFSQGVQNDNWFQRGFS